MTMTETTTGERADLLQSLTIHRKFFLITVAGLSDEQAARRTTASALCLGGLIKHVAEVESTWVDFILQGPSAMAGADGATDWTSRFQMEPGETLAELVAHYEQVAQRTDEVLATSARPRHVASAARRADGSSRAPAGPHAGSCSTSSPRRPNMPGTPTSSARASTAPRPWARRHREAIRLVRSRSRPG